MRGPLSSKRLVIVGVDVRSKDRTDKLKVFLALDHANQLLVPCVLDLPLEVPPLSVESRSRLQDMPNRVVRVEVLVGKLMERVQILVLYEHSFPSGKQGVESLSEFSVSPGLSHLSLALALSKVSTIGRTGENEVGQESSRVICLVA